VNQAPHGREGQRIQQGTPAVVGHGVIDRFHNRIGQSIGQLGGHRGPRLGGAAGHPKRPNHPSGVDQRLDFLGPRDLFGLHTGVQRVAQPPGQRTGILVGGGGGDVFSFLGDASPDRVQDFDRNEGDTIELFSSNFTALAPDEPLDRDAFYKGAIARTMDAYFRRIGGDLRYEDFAAHTGEWVKPLSVPYRGYEVHELPPNGQGGAVLQMLRILQGYDLKAMGAGSADTLTAMIEAKRLAYEDLARWYADPAFAKVPMDALLSQRYANERRSLIRLDRANPDVGPGEPQLHDGDTIYLSTADSDGMMVSLIQSNYRGMGSGLVADGLGFMFQDRGELFSLDPASANVYAPGKRPFHTIIPGFVTKDGKPFMAFGLMGGDMQPQGHVQVLTNIIDFGMNVQEAGDAARWRHAGGSPMFTLETLRAALPRQATGAAAPGRGG